MNPVRANEVAVAAHLAVPSRYPIDDGPRQVDPDGMLRLLRDNKVMLAHVDRAGHPECGWLFDEPWFGASRQAEIDELAHQRRQYEEIDDAFREEDIGQILFKSSGLYPYKSDNLDTLVPADRVSTARRILSRLGYIELVHWENEPEKYLYRRFDRGRSFTVHLHSSVQWDGPPILDVNQLRSAAVTAPDGTFRHPCPEDAFVVALGHFFWENRVLRLLDLRLVSDALSKEDFDWDRVWRNVTDRRWVNEFGLAVLLVEDAEVKVFGTSLLPRQLVDESRRQTRTLRRIVRFPSTTFKNARVPPFSFSKFATKPYTYARMFRGSEPSVGRNMLYIFSDVANATQIVTRVNRRMIQDPALIAVAGIDGSGKTTQVSRLQEAFEACEIRTVSFWTRTRFAPSVERLKGIARRTRARSLVPIDADDKVRTRSRPLIRVGWEAAVVVHALWALGVKARVLLLARNVVLCDRHLVDAVADIGDFLGDPHPHERRSARMLRRLVRKPDATVFLDVDPAVAASRKSGENLDPYELMRLRDIYTVVAAADGAEFVSADGDEEQTTNAVLRVCMNEYFSRYRNVRLRLQHTTHF